MRLTGACVPVSFAAITYVVTKVNKQCVSNASQNVKLLGARRGSVDERLFVYAFIRSRISNASSDNDGTITAAAEPSSHLQSERVSSSSTNVITGSQESEKEC